MALALRSRDGCAPNSRLSTLLGHLPPAAAAGSRLRATSATASEYDAYHERETWQKLRAERDKDLVLMFGDDDVRVFHRGAQRAETAAAGPRGLQPVQLDASFHRIMTSVTGGGSGAAGQRAGGTTQHIARARRRLRLDQHLQRGPAEVGSASDMPGAALQVEGDDAAAAVGGSHGIPPSSEAGHRAAAAVPNHSQWARWIRGSDDQQRVVAKARGKLRRRHHRQNCKFHPLSTNAEFRRLALQMSFPRSAIDASVGRIQHAASGSPSGVEADEFFDLDACFAPPTLVGECATGRPTSRGAAMLQEEHGGAPASAKRPVATGRACESTSVDGAAAEGEGGVLQLRDDLHSGTASWGGASDEFSVNGTFAFLTEPPMRSMGARCATPELARFRRPFGKHILAASAHFCDCSCSDRSTDDELCESLEHASGGETQSSSLSHTRGIAGTADRAARRVLVTQRKFALATVHANSALRSLLQERDEQREIACSERRHLNVVTEAAEQCGADWRISRRQRSTTPVHGSVWLGVFAGISDDLEHLERNRAHYVTVVDECAKLGFPADPRELALLIDFRSICCRSSRKQTKATHVLPTQSSDVATRPSSRHSARASTPGTADGSQRTQRAVRGAGARGFVAPTASSASSPPRSSVFLASAGSGDGGGSMSKNTISRRRNRQLSRAATPSLSGTFASRGDATAAERWVAEEVSGRGVGGGATPGEQTVASRLLQDSLVDVESVPLKEDVMTPATFFTLLRRHGEALVTTSRGVRVLDLLRHLCGVGAREFLAAVYAHEGSWAIGSEMHRLHKRLTATRGDAIGKGSRVDAGTRAGADEGDQ